LGKLPARLGNSYDAIAPYDSYAAKDGWLVIGCGNQKLFEILCNELLKKPELITDKRFATVPLRVENNKVFKVFMEEWLADKTVDEAVKAILDAGIPAGPIFDLKQIAENEHIAKAREMFVTIDHPVMGEIKLNGNPIKLSDTKAEIKMASPTLGQHNEEIFFGLGYNNTDIEMFKTLGVI
jgi:formyl-CoA transferase